MYLIIPLFTVIINKEFKFGGKKNDTVEKS